MKKEFGKYLLDISKLVLGGVVLTSVLEISNVNKIAVTITGTIVAILLLIFGLLFLKK